MKYLLTVIHVEFIKAFKAKALWLTAIGFTLAPLMAGFFMFLLKDPDSADNTGLIGMKAQIAGEAHWHSYLDLYGQIIAVGGIFVFGFITSWIFGREFADRTITDLLALPIGRSTIVLAKFIVSFIVHLLLSVYVVLLGLIIGLFLNLPYDSFIFLLNKLKHISFITLQTSLLSTPVAFIASFSRGYLAPLGFIMIILTLSQILIAIGYGLYFPWSIPAIASGMVKDASTSWYSHFQILMITLLGIFSTLYQWNYTDHR